MTTTLLIIIGSILIIGFAALGYLFWQKSERDKKELKELREDLKNDSSITRINQNLQGLETRFSKNMQTIRTSFSEKLENNSRVVASVNRELGVIKEMNDQMKSLQAMFRSPKLRGNIGEQVLKDLLEQVLPKEHFAMQYKFHAGQTVDAIIKTKNEIIPIDSKFPTENFLKLVSAKKREEKKIYLRHFQRDVKKHIKDVSEKYILPSEKTVDFAVMYIPSESIYYWIVTKNEELNKFANRKKVYLVSPNTFYYFLQTILIGIERTKIGEAAGKILSTLKEIKNDAGDFSEHLGIVSRHLTNAKNQMDNVQTEFITIKDKIDNTSNISAGEERVVLDKPKIELEESDGQKVKLFD